MATTVFVNNVNTSVPGVYTTIDASGLATVGLSATGIVALLGTAQGGFPYTAAGGDAASLPRLTNPQQLASRFASGDLLDGGNMLFDPSSDQFIQGGAQVVIAVQVNKADQAKATLTDGTDDSLTLTAQAYGAGGNNVTAKVEAGSVTGVKLTLRNTSTGAAESKDNLADVAAIVAWVNTTSRLASAQAAAGSPPPLPAVTTSDVSFAGGAEQSAAFADWQAGLDLIKQLRVNTVVALTSDPAVNAAVQAHCEYMCGQGRSERDAIVGVQGANGGLPTLAEYLDATQQLNTRHLRACGQSVARYDAQGLVKVYPPHFMAAIAAGMQAGGGLGLPLTRKVLKAVAVYQDSSWNPMDNADQLIQGGAFIAQRIDGKGIRWVRNVTTYLQDNNLAFVEASTNACVNFTAFTTRDQLEFVVGQPGFSGTVNQVKTAAQSFLTQLVQAKIIVAYNSISVVQQNDQFQVSFAIQPSLPVNFVPVTLHLQPTLSANNPAAAA